MSKSYDILKRAVAIFRAEVAGMSKSERVVLGLFVVAHLVSHVYEIESKDGTDAERLELKADIVKAFHDLFDQVDIPYLPKSVEILVESLIAQPLEQGLDIVSAKFASIRAQIDELEKKVT